VQNHPGTIVLGNPFLAGNKLSFFAASLTRYLTRMLGRRVYGR
jgi:hypothetical protein